MTSPSDWSADALDKRLGGIRWRLDAATFGTLKRQEIEVPRLIEAMRLVTECVVWGERRHDTKFMELFQKHTMLEALVCVLRTADGPRPVKTQALQSLSILAPQVQNESSMVYLLSVMNPLFDEPPDLDEEEMVAYFATLLKGSALRLNGDNVEYCIVVANSRMQETCTEDSTAPQISRLPHHIPIFDCAINMVNHKEFMVRIAARTAILSVLGLEHRRAQTAATHAMVQLLAPRLAQSIRIGVDGVEDLLEFVEDMLRLEVPMVTAALEQVGFRADSQGRVELMTFRA